MNRLNVFSGYMLPWRSPRNWFTNIQTFFRRIKYAYQRAIHGYSDSDCWNLDSFYLNLFYKTLIDLAENHQGFPDNQFKSDEEWTQYLKETALCFYRANEDNETYECPMFHAWENYLYKYSRKFNENPLTESMLEEARANQAKRMEDFQKGWEMMGKVFFDLWD